MFRKAASSFVLILAGLPALSAGAVATTSFSAADEGPNPKAVQVAKAPGGHLIAVKLTALAKGTKVHGARLRAARGKLEDPKALLVDIEVYPGRRAAGKPLPLAPPDYGSFDATDAVAKAVAAAGQLELFVKTFPGWRQETTRLEVTYEGAPPAVPSAVSGINALHRAGQTFITWKEVDPPITAEKCTWGQYRKALAGAKAPCTYRVYAHGKPIDAKSFLQAELLGEVGPGSCWNVNGRNLEYLIGQAMIQTDEIGELARGHNSHMYTWGMNSPRMDRYPLARLVVDAKAGPLPPGTGLYVASPARAGKRYYAVVSCKAGVENLVDFGEANSLARPVNETVGPGVPVRQGKGLWGPFFDYPGRRKVYVQWVGPPLAPRPNMYFNWSVLVAPKVKAGEKLHAELYFHKGNFSYAKPRQKFILRSIQIAPHDWPPSGWYGYNDAFGTLKSFAAGTVGNHTQRRIIAFLDWAIKTLPIDPDRILLPGSDGAALLALNYPERFAYVLINNFESAVLRYPGKFVPAWGPKSPKVKDAHGRGEWGWAMLDKIVEANRARDLPVIYCKRYSWGRYPRTKTYRGRGKGRFYTAMLKANQPIIANWSWLSGALIKPNKYTGIWRGLDMTRHTPVPAFANCSTDADKESNGQLSLSVTWKPVREGRDFAEVTLFSHGVVTFDLAFRRLQKLKPAPGRKLSWKALSVPAGRYRGKKPPPQNGTIVVDKDGVVVIQGLKIAGRCDLKVKVTAGR